MPSSWKTIKLNDGNEIPGFLLPHLHLYGTGSHDKGQPAINEFKQALSQGFTHIDTAQLYGNEEEVGKAIKESGVARNNLFITTKYSHNHGVDTDIPSSIKDSLKFLGVSHVDLYLIHYPSAAVPDIPTSWKYFEDFRRKGWAKSIGVSNFDIRRLKILLASARIKPAVNQIMLHPYVYPSQAPIIDFCKANGIAVEAYSTLVPLYRMVGGPLDKPLARIVESRCASPEEILLAWAKAKGVVVITTSRNRQRLQQYLAAGDIELTESEIAAIDAAGKEGAVDPPPYRVKFTTVLVGKMQSGFNAAFRVDFSCLHQICQSCVVPTRAYRRLSV